MPFTRYNLVSIQWNTRSKIEAVQIFFFSLEEVTAKCRSLVFSGCSLRWLGWHLIERSIRADCLYERIGEDTRENDYNYHIWVCDRVIVKYACFRRSQAFVVSFTSWLWKISCNAHRWSGSLIASRGCRTTRGWFQRELPIIGLTCLHLNARIRRNQLASLIMFLCLSSLRHHIDWTKRPAGELSTLDVRSSRARARFRQKKNERTKWDQ